MSAEVKSAPRVLSLAEAVTLLDVYTDPCKLCRNELDSTGIATGHVAGGHPPPRRVVHCQLGGLGADWDEESVIDFLGRATVIVAVPEDTFLGRTGHRIAGKGTFSPEDTQPPRWHAFTAHPAPPLP